MPEGCAPKDYIYPHPKSVKPESSQAQSAEDLNWKGPIRYHTLEPEASRVLLHEATEPPGSGSYCDKTQEGIYLCRQCDNPLFLTSDQIPTHCGWPSFDEALPEGVYERMDRDQRRTEVLCKRCGGHLGHLFTGERFTAKNKRYCINSLSLRRTDSYTKEGLERAIFAAGCFWGVQKDFEQIPGVVRTQVGYIGGRVTEPSYQEVCQKNTGHAEAVEVFFDSKKVAFETLLDAFFKLHDPTLYHRQGPDIGSQYRSALFYLTALQRDQAIEKVVNLRKEGLAVVTEIVPASLFYPAEAYHQHYYKKSCS